MKSLGNVVNYGLLALWIISVGILISIGINQMTQFAVEGRVVKKETINLNPNDTLNIKFVHNQYFSKNVDDHDDFNITQDSTDNDVIYSNQVEFRIERTDEKLPYMQIEKEAKGKSLSVAKKTAEKIRYGYKIIGNQLILDNYLLTDFANKYRDQEVEITLYLPKGTKFKAHESVRRFDASSDDYFNLHYSSADYIYRVGEDKVKCMNCPAEENEYGDVENAVSGDTVITTVKVNGEVITVNKTGRGGLTTDANGVIIKK